MIGLNGKRALVAGGSRGIGSAIVLALAENGADVAFTYQHSVDQAAQIAKSIESKGRRAFAIQADSADPGAIARSVSEAVSALGGLDILVNNSAVGLSGMIADIDLDAYQKMMDINVRGPVLFAKAVIPHLTEGGRDHLDRFGLGRAGAVSGRHCLRDVEGSPYVLNPRPLARTRTEGDHCQPRATRLDRYGFKSSRWRRC